MKSRPLWLMIPGAILGAFVVFALLLFLIFSIFHEQVPPIELGSGYLFDYGSRGERVVSKGNRFYVLEEILQIKYDNTYLVAEQKPRYEFSDSMRLIPPLNYDEAKAYFKTWRVRRYFVINKWSGVMYKVKDFAEYDSLHTALQLPDSLRLCPSTDE